MAINTYATLKTSVASWLARSGDTKITSNVADFITLAEAYLNRVLRVRQMETVSTFTTTSGVRNLPSDYLAWKRLTWLGDTYSEVDYMVPDTFNRFHPGADAGVPANFTIEGENIKIRPYDDSTSFEFLYYAKIAALEDADDTNWLLTAHPDLYLAATMAEANAFLINPDHAALWIAKRDAIVDELIKLSVKTSGPARMIPVGAFY